MAKKEELTTGKLKDGRQFGAAQVTVETPKTEPNYTCVACNAPPICRGKAPGQNCPAGSQRQ